MQRMCGQLDSYLLAFANLRVDKNRNTWTELTNYCSPYKPFLLLSVLDHVASGRIATNFVEPGFDLIETFQSYIALLPQSGRQASMSYPFYYLESSLFWEMVPQAGFEHRRGLAISSMKRLRELYHGARMANDLFKLMQMEHAREKLRNILVQTYFAREIQGDIMEQSFVNCASDNYSTALLCSHEPLPLPEHFFELQGHVSREQVRDQGFRKAIIRLYQHRCALCGIKMLTPEGYTVVDAAHIKPWSESRNDSPTNGMALCKLCHWSFDAGLMSVDKSYQVLISPAVKKDPNLPGHMLTLSDRPIFRPPESHYWPDQVNFAWHRAERFRKRG